MYVQCHNVAHFLKKAVRVYPSLTRRKCRYNLIEINLVILLYNIFIYTSISQNNEFEDKSIPEYSNNRSNSDSPQPIERRTSRTENIMNDMLVPALFLLDQELLQMKQIRMGTLMTNEPSSEAHSDKVWIIDAICFNCNKRFTSTRVDHCNHRSMREAYILHQFRRRKGLQ